MEHPEKHQKLIRGMTPTEYYIQYRNKNREVIQKINREFRKRTSVSEFKKICAEKDDEIKRLNDIIKSQKNVK